MRYLIFFTLFILGALSPSCKTTKSSTVKTENQRLQLVQGLMEEVRRERDTLLESGIDDGTGLLYQSTPAYQKLAPLCSKAELAKFHKSISYAQYFVPPPNTGSAR